MVWFSMAVFEDQKAAQIYSTEEGNKDGIERILEGTKWQMVCWEQGGLVCWHASHFPKLEYLLTAVHIHAYIMAITSICHLQDLHQ